MKIAFKFKLYNNCNIKFDLRNKTNSAINFCLKQRLFPKSVHIF